MRGQKYRLRGWLLNHPRVDYVIALLPSVVLYSGGLVPQLDSDTRIAFAAAVSTISGLVMTAATFACTMTYQSASILMSRVRDAYASELRHNWTSIIFGAFLAAVMPVVGLILPQREWLVIQAGVTALALTGMQFGRSVFWLGYTLFMQGAADSLPVIKMPKVGAATRRKVGS